MVAQDIEPWLREKSHLIDRKIVGFPDPDAPVSTTFRGMSEEITKGIVTRPANPITDMERRRKNSLLE